MKSFVVVLALAFLSVSLFSATAMAQPEPESQTIGTAFEEFSQTLIGTLDLFDFERYNIFQISSRIIDTAFPAIYNLSDAIFEALCNPVITLCGSIITLAILAPSDFNILYAFYRIPLSICDQSLYPPERN